MDTRETPNWSMQPGRQYFPPEHPLAESCAVSVLAHHWVARGPGRTPRMPTAMLADSGDAAGFLLGMH